MMNLSEDVFALTKLAGVESAWLIGSGVYSSHPRDVDVALLANDEGGYDSLMRVLARLPKNKYRVQRITEYSTETAPGIIHVVVDTVASLSERWRKSIHLEGRRVSNMPLGDRRRT